MEKNKYEKAGLDFSATTETIKKRVCEDHVTNNFDRTKPLENQYSPPPVIFFCITTQPYCCIKNIR